MIASAPQPSRRARRRGLEPGAGAVRAACTAGAAARAAGAARTGVAAALWLAVASPAMAALFGTLFAGSPPATLGVRDGRLAPCPDRPNCVSSEATDDAHRVAALDFTGDPAAALQRLDRVIAGQDSASIVTRRDGYLHAEFTTRLMGFVDDFEARVDLAAGVIQVRSASRLGYGDLGVNRGRVEAIRAAFRATAK